MRYQAASDENKEKYHWGDYQLSQYQIPHYHHCDNNVMALGKEISAEWKG